MPAAHDAHRDGKGKGGNKDGGESERIKDGERKEAEYRKKIGK